jgi:hypothetical protein
MSVLRTRLRRVLALWGTLVLFACGPQRQSEKGSAKRILRVVRQTDLKTLDPVWRTSDITRDNGYMIYDTLFGLDVNALIVGEVGPAPASIWTISIARPPINSALQPLGRSPSYLG